MTWWRPVSGSSAGYSGEPTSPANSVAPCRSTLARPPQARCHPPSSKCLCAIFVIIHEICMWLNGYFASSVVVIRRCPHLPPSSSTTVVCQYVKIHTSAFYQLHPQISCAEFIYNLPIAISALYHWPMFKCPVFNNPKGIFKMYWNWEHNCKILCI